MLNLEKMELSRHSKAGFPLCNSSTFYFSFYSSTHQASWGSTVKNLPETQETFRRCGFDLWARKIPWRRKWQPTSVLLPAKPYGEEPGRLHRFT